MAQPYASNPLPYVVSRQIDNKVDYRKKLLSTLLETSKNLFRKDLLAHYGCVNAIEFSSQGDLLLSGGDDKRVLLWKVEQMMEGVGKPAVMKTEHDSNIFCLGYDSSKTKVFSAGNDEQVIVHDLRTADVMNYVPHEKAVYGLSIHPQNDNVFASACEDGRVLMYDIRGSSASAFCLAQYKTAFHSVMFNPMEPRMLATGNAKEGVSMWDARKPLEPVFRYVTNVSNNPRLSCMCVRFNSMGTRLLALRRRLPPIIYAVDSSEVLCRFYHPGYYNSCTMKSCCFAGLNDEYVLSGSDDFNLYMWKIPEEGVPWVNSAHMVLPGHRSIVNQVRYNPASCVFASSGVEKIIKIWSPFYLGYGCLGGLKRGVGEGPRPRRVFTHSEYIGLVLRSGQFMTHDYSHQSTREDPRMMAFFDSLVQREIEGWNTSTDSENSPTTPRTFSATDSDASDHQLRLSILGPAVSARERSLQARHRITRTLLRLGSMNSISPDNSTSNPSATTRESPASGSSTPRTFSATESDDSIALDQLRLSILETAVSARARIIQARRRITRTVHRLGLMNSISQDNTTSNQSGTTREPSASAPKSKGDTVQRPSRTKSQSKSKAVKRKHTKVNSESGSGEVHDTTLPSTSSGVISSTSSRYSVNSLQKLWHETKDSSSSTSSTSSSSSESSSDSSSSSSSSGEEDNPPETSGKRKYSKIESDKSAKKTQWRKNRKCKTRTRRGVRKCKIKRQKVEKEESDEEKTARKVRANGSGSTKPEEDGPSTSHAKSRKVPSTPDSGITSAVSSAEKNSEEPSSEPHDGASSNHEQRLQELEFFRKKLDIVRRTYINRSLAQLLPSVVVAICNDTDSSD